MLNWLLTADSGVNVNTTSDDFTYVSFSEIECERSVSNWLLPVDSGVTVNTNCDNFTSVSFSEIECELSVSNWLLPVDCGVTVNTTCDNFTYVSFFRDRMRAKCVKLAITCRLWCNSEHNL